MYICTHIHTCMNILLGTESNPKYRRIVCGTVICILKFYYFQYPENLCGVPYRLFQSFDMVK